MLLLYVLCVVHFSFFDIINYVASGNALQKFHSKTKKNAFQNQKIWSRTTVTRYPIFQNNESHHHGTPLSKSRNHFTKSCDYSFPNHATTLPQMTRLHFVSSLPFCQMTWPHHGRPPRADIASIQWLYFGHKIFWGSWSPPTFSTPINRKRTQITNATTHRIFQEIENRRKSYTSWHMLGFWETHY